MDFKFWITLISILLFTTCVQLVCNTIKKINKKNNIVKLKEIEIQKMDLFMKMDSKLAEDEIDKMVINYLNEYMLNNFIVKNIDFIRKEEIDKMVKDLDKIILINISELYLFYVKIIVNIDNEDDLLYFINKKVKEHVLDIVTEFNRPK